jgi:hypothetical protein
VTGLGSSAGRSSGNRTGDGARRRNTPRERAQIDPPLDLVEVFSQDAARRRRRTELWLNGLAVLSVLGFIALLTFIVLTWWS